MEAAATWEAELGASEEAIVVVYARWLGLLSRSKREVRMDVGLVAGFLVAWVKRRCCVRIQVRRM